MPIETALETERRQDAEVRFPSSDRTAGCRKGASGSIGMGHPDPRRTSPPAAGHFARMS
jgi:hypothetical protein